jgi:hypothetical protein
LANVTLGLEIVMSMQDRQITSSRILKGFIESAVIADNQPFAEGEDRRAAAQTRADLLNLSVLFADALERTREFYDYFVSTGKFLPSERDNALYDHSRTPSEIMVDIFASSMKKSFSCPVPVSLRSRVGVRERLFEGF